MGQTRFHILPDTLPETKGTEEGREGLGSNLGIPVKMWTV